MLSYELNFQQLQFKKHVTLDGIVIIP